MNVAPSNNPIAPSTPQSAMFNSGNMSAGISPPAPPLAGGANVSGVQQQSQQQVQQPPPQQVANPNNFSQPLAIAAESPIPKQWWDQDANAASNNSSANYPQRSQTPTQLNSAGMTQVQPPNSSYNSYYANGNPGTPNAHQSPQQPPASRQYPSSYAARPPSPGPSHLGPAPPQQPQHAQQQQQQQHYTQPAASNNQPIPYNKINLNHSGHLQYPPSNHNTYPRRDSSLPPPTNRHTVSRDGSLPPTNRNSSLPPRRDGSLPPTLRNDTSQMPPRAPSSSLGLIRITLRKPMGIVFEPIPADSPATQPQRGVRICELPRTGAAALSRKLEVGDELLSINDKTMSRLTFDEIMDFIIDADPDRVNLLFRRPRKEEIAGNQQKGGSDNASGDNNPKVKWIDESHGDSTYKDSYKSDRRRENLKERVKEKASGSKKKRRSRRHTDPDSLLDLLIDSICSPLVQGETPTCVQNLKQMKRDDDTDSDEDTFISQDSSTYYTQESSFQDRKDRKQKSKHKSKTKELEEEDEYSINEGSTLETAQDRDLRRKKFKERKFGRDDSVTETTDRNEKRNSKKQIDTPYEDDATLETIETYERNKNVEDSSYIPQRPLGLSEEPITKLQIEETIDENKALSPKNKNRMVPGNIPIEELEYDDQIDGGDVSVMTPSLVDFSSQAREFLPGMQVDESIQKSPTKFYRHVVKHLLETHEPEKVRLLDKLLAKYENREEHLIQKLTVRYNRKTEAESNPPTINEDEPYSDRESVERSDFGAGFDATPSDFPSISETNSGDNPVTVVSAQSNLDDGEQNEDNNSAIEETNSRSDTEENFDPPTVVEGDLSRSQSFEESQPGNIPGVGSNSFEQEDPNMSFGSFPLNQSQSPTTSRSDSTDVEQPIDDEEDSNQSGSVYSDDYSGSSIDGTSPAVIAQVSELLNFVYGKTSVPGQIDRVSTIMRAYEGRESVLLELLETKALIKANTQNEKTQKESPQNEHQPEQGSTANTDSNSGSHMNVNGPSIAVDGDYGARDDISSVSAGSHSRGAKNSLGADQMDIIESRIENDAVLLTMENKPPASLENAKVALKPMGLKDKSKQDAVAKVIQEQHQKPTKKKGIFGFLKRGKKKKKGGFPKKKKGGLQSKVDDDDSS